MRKNYKKRIVLTLIITVVVALMITVTTLLINKKSADTRSQAGELTNIYDLRAKVKYRGEYLDLQTPLYITDVYTGVWGKPAKDPLIIARDFREKPNNVPGDFYLGEYTRENMGSEATIRKQLQIMKDYQITPSIHIMNRHEIKETSPGIYKLIEWNDYGITREGVTYYSYDIFNRFWKPLLEETKTPYVLTIDMWFFDAWAPKNIPQKEYYRLWWEEMEHILPRIDLTDSSNDSNFHIKFREYTANYNIEAYHPGIILLLGSSAQKLSLCERTDINVRYSFLRAAGNPGGLRRNPVTKKELDLNNPFWFLWYSYTPDIKGCLNTDNGQWNIVNFNWETDSLTEKEKQNNWVESMDILGPRYFYGYMPHFRDKISANPGRHLNVSGTETERIILQDKALEKGVVFVGYWNEYAETVLSPSQFNENDGDKCEHNPWVNGRPVRLDNFFNAKIKTKYPKALQTPILTPLPTNSNVPEYSTNWEIRFYNTNDLSGSIVDSREIETLKVSPGIGSPTPKVNANNYSLIAKKKISLSQTKSYTFKVFSDDGVRVYIDGELIINEWRNQGTTGFTRNKTLTPGLHEIEVQYFEGLGYSFLALEIK